MAEYSIEGILHTSPLLFEQARQAAQGELRNGQHSLRDSLTAIVFSVASMDALVGEVAEIAGYWQTHGVGGKKIETFAEAMDELERGRSQLRLRLAPLLLDRPPFREDVEPFSEYLLLVRLRNELVHLRPSRLIGRAHSEEEAFALPLGLGPDLRVSPPEVLRRLAQRGIVSSAEAITLLHAIPQARVASWAVNSVSAMARWFLDLFPVEVAAGDDVKGLRESFAPVKDPLVH